MTDDTITVGGQKFTIKYAPTYSRARITMTDDPNFATISADRDAHQCGSYWQVWYGEPSPSNRPIGPDHGSYGMFYSREEAVRWVRRCYGPQPDWRTGVGRH